MQAVGHNRPSAPGIGENFPQMPDTSGKSGLRLFQAGKVEIDRDQTDRFAGIGVGNAEIRL